MISALVSKTYKEMKDMTKLFTTVSYNVNNYSFANVNPFASFVAPFGYDADYSNSNINRS